uniref:Oxysterol-binding protein-related protein 1D n=1 Tax=Zea mays TaxID=4577 RepID=A0A804LQD0_MAIZE
MLHRAGLARARCGSAPRAPAAHPRWCTAGDAGPKAGCGCGGAAQVGQLWEGVAVAVVRARGWGAILLQAPRSWCWGGSRVARCCCSQSDRGRECRAAGKLWKPFGVIHLKVSSIRASKSDDKRLYIFSGTKTLHLRCETEEDRNAWIDALLAAKDQFPRSQTSNDVGSMADIMLSSEKLRARLLQEGLCEAVVRECESIMMSELLELHNHIKSQQQQHSILIDRLRQLETEKVELERTVVHETKERETLGYANSRQSDFYSVLSGGSTTESDPDTASHMAEVETEEDEVTYFDTRDFLSAESLRSASCQRRELIAHGFGSEYVGDSVTNTVKTTKYPFVLRRDKLPEPKEKEKHIGLWSIIRENIGKDLSG